MEERIPQRPREAKSPTGTPCDDHPVAPVVQLLSSSDDEGDELEFEFEFPFVSRDSPAGTAAPADELFADGRIRTFYPVFGRGCTAAAAAAPPPRVRGQLGKLFLEDDGSSSSGVATDDDGLEGAAPESYCVWRPGSATSASPSPSPRRPTPPRKSGSTGSMARWRRISDLVVGRSHSDGREKFVFLAAAPARRHRKPAPAPATAPAPAPAPAPAGARKQPPSSVAAPATEAAHRIAYLASSRGGLGVPVPVPPVGTPRRTFLPYREELVGFFANVNGISRSHHHPF